MRNLPFDFVGFSIFSCPDAPGRLILWFTGRRLFRSVQMASEIFAKIGDIKGESLDSKHKDEIEVLSFSWGVTNTGAKGFGGGGGEGKATFHDLSFVHNIDKASPMLMQACATGTHVKEATITHRKAGKDQQDYLIIKMNDIIITGVTDGDASGQGGSETVSLAFAKIDLEYKPQKADGSLDTGIHFKYDLKANKEG
jgi:type VI secretion system secreted protein Hcp